MTLRPLIPKTHFDSIAPVQMWSDDMVEVVNLMKEVANGDPLEIYSSGYQLDEIEDIRQIPSPTVDFVKVLLPSRRIELSLSERDSFIRAEDPGLIARGMITEIIRVSQRCRRSKFHMLRAHPKARAYTFIASVSILVTYVLLLSQSRVGVTPVSKLDVWVLIVTIGAGVLLMIPALVASLSPKFFKPKSFFYTKIRVEAPTFWERKKDDLTITIVSNSISLLVGGAIGYLINMIS